MYSPPVAREQPVVHRFWSPGALALGAGALLGAGWRLAWIGRWMLADARAGRMPVFNIPVTLGFGILAVIGVLILRSTPDVYRVDPKAGTLEHWTGVAGRAGHQSFELAGVTGLRLHQERRLGNRKVHMKRILSLVRGHERGEELFEHYWPGPPRKLAQELAGILDLPVTDEIPT